MARRNDMLQQHEHLHLDNHLHTICPHLKAEIERDVIQEEAPDLLLHRGHLIFEC